MAKLASNTFTGAQLGLTYIGKEHCYAWSGQVVATGGGEGTLLSFKTGNKYVIGDLCFTENERGSNNIELKGFLNGVRVIDSEYDATPQETRHVYPMLIPPNTTFLLIFSAGGTNVDGTAWFSGRVYE